MDERLIKDAQYRKGLGIAYFNATNSTIELAKIMFPDLEGVDVKAFIVEWRQWFLDEHKKYYAEVIANIGKPYDAKESIEKLQETNNVEDLRSVWLSLSEDERRDGQIREVAKQERAKYEKA